MSIREVPQAASVQSTSARRRRAAGGGFVACPERLEGRALLSGALPAFAPVDPATGSLAYRTSAVDTLAAGQVRSFTFDSEAGQMITIVATPKAASGGVSDPLDLGVSLINPSSALQADADARPAGEAEVIHTVQAVGAGTYTIEVRGIAGSGDVALTVLLGAAAESEAQAGGVPNDVFYEAQDINGSFIDLGAGGVDGRTASRAAAIGVLPVGRPVAGGAQDFETVATGVVGDRLATAFTTWENGPGGAINLIDQQDFSGRHIIHFAGDWRSGQVGLLQELIWTLNLSGVADATLSFDAISSWDLNPFQGDFTGHYNADGVAISANGVDWHPVLSLPYAGHFRSHTIDLAAEAARAGMALTGNFQIKFQHYDDYSFENSAGWGLDNLKVATPDRDWYRLDLTGGDHVSLQAHSTDPYAAAAMSLELYDPSGNLAAVGEVDGAAGLSGSVVRDFDVPALGGGSWAARVSANYTRDADYTLLVAKNVSLNAGSHQPASPAQDLGETGRVFGHAGTSLGRLFSVNQRYSSSTHDDGIFEIDPATGQTINFFPGGFSRGTVAGATTPHSLLTAGYRAIYELDPDTGATLRTLAAPAVFNPSGMAYANGAIYVHSIENNRLWVIDYDTGELVRSLQPPAGFRGALASTDTGLLAAGAAPQGGYRIYEINPDTGLTGIRGDMPVGGPNPNSPPEAMAVIGDELFIRASGSYRVDVADRRTLRVLRSFTTPENQGWIINDLAGDGGPAGDWYYTIPAVAGDVLTLSTATPGADAPGGAPNTLDPLLALYTPDGTLAAEDDNGGGDGRNALLAHTATQTGDYHVRVRAPRGAGDFVLSAAGYTGAAPEFRVTGTDPASGAGLVVAPTSITVDFSAPPAAASLQAADLTVGGVAATGVTMLDADTARFTLPALRNGRHRVTMARGAAADAAAGTPLDAYAGEFSVQLVGARVYGSSVQQGEVRVPGALSLWFSFDRALREPLDVNDFALTGGRSGAHAPAAWGYNPGTLSFSADYAGLPDDDYTMRLYSGNGQFEAADGGDLDGEVFSSPVGPAGPSGDGVAGGSFAVQFSLIQPVSVAAPEGLLTQPVSGTEIELYWADHSNNEQTFRIERADGAGEFVEIGQSPANLPRYRDTTAGRGVGVHRYRVRAITRGGESDYSNEVSASALSPELSVPVARLPVLPPLTASTDTNPSPVVTMGGTGYFTVADYTGPIGRAALWQTDGTPGGTTQVKVWDFGSASTVGVSDGLLYFTRTERYGDTYLWRTDGTADGTTQIGYLFMVSPSLGNNPRVTGAADAGGGVLVFAVFHPDTSRTDLYSADGTPDGTEVIRSSTGWSGNPTAYRGKVYVSKWQAQPPEVWETDGTAAGTHASSDFVPGLGAVQRVEAGGAVYWVEGVTLYRNADGTPGGTTAVADDPAFGAMEKLTAVEGGAGGVGAGVAYVTRQYDQGTGAVYNDLWFNDGLAAGARRLHRGNTQIGNVGVARQAVYFTPGQELWKSDPASGGAAAVRVVSLLGTFANLAPLNGLLTFRGGYPNQLWATDGTEEGSRAILSAGISSPAHPDWLTASGGAVYFVSSKLEFSPYSYWHNSGQELWRTDGTAEGTVRLFTGAARDLFDVNGTLYFAGADAYKGYELWKTDGTVAGTVRVKDITPGANSSNPRALTVYNGRLYFAVETSFNGWQLWSTDGTEAGTARALDIHIDIGFTEDYTTRFAVFGGHLFFVSASNQFSSAGYLYRTDGTNEGTIKITGFPNDSYQSVRKIRAAGGSLFVIAGNSEESQPQSLYRVAPGAASVELLYAGLNGSSYGGAISNLTDVNGTLYFTAPHAGGYALWHSDGTAAGTAVAVSGVGRPSSLTQVGGGTMYFLGGGSGADGAAPAAVYRTDGTQAGTARIRDFVPASEANYGARPMFLTAAADHALYADGEYLWRTDGAFANTIQVDTIGTAGDGTRSPAMFGGPAAVALGDRLFYSAAVPGGGRELRVASLTTPGAPSGLRVIPPGQSAGAAAAAGPGVASALLPRITWVDGAANESGFLLERSTWRDFSTVERRTFVAPNTTEALDTTAAPDATYYYRVRAVNAGGSSAFSNAASTGPSVAGRHVFYNRSAFDGNDPAATAADDAAIATDKRPLLPGQRATFANYTSYSRGINGIMVDLAGLTADVSLTAADFVFKVGNDNNPAAWAAAPTPLGVTRRAGAGVRGSDRFTITWADGAIKGKWLQVTVKANANTGLRSPDVFYYGNAPGESGNFATAALVNSTDESAARHRPRGAWNPAPVTFRWDYNRDRLVNLADQMVARRHRTTAATALQLITTPRLSTLASAPAANGFNVAARPPALFSAAPIRPGGSGVEELFEARAE